MSSLFSLDLWVSIWKFEDWSCLNCGLRAWLQHNWVKLFKVYFWSREKAVVEEQENLTKNIGNHAWNGALLSTVADGLTWQRFGRVLRSGKTI